MTTEREYVNLLPTVIAEADAVLPDGMDSWGIKSVRPDLETTRGFRWALPGGLNISSDALDLSNTSACPAKPGDGLCVATTWRGMASGGIPARTLLLVAYLEADIVGRNEPAGKLRIGGPVASVALIDGERLIREHGSRAKLQRADLRDADLRYADLQDADLRGADLRDVDLRRADLRRADLRRADLRRVDLRYADLQDADLRGADLRDVDLRYADLRGADLRDADLQDADLRYANLQDAALQGALWTIGAPPPNGWTLTDTGHLAMETTR